MYKLEIYYSIRNGGDGSAYPVFMESADLCRIDQKYMHEGWAEDCSGSILVQSESPITCTREVRTVEKEIQEAEEDLRWANKYKDTTEIDRLAKMLEELKTLQEKKNEESYAV
jgi:hypothetical protein